jgi:hypothetical protein
MQQLHVPRPSAVGIILAASDISGPTVLGELPDWVSQRMALPERVTKVQADNRVMFHLAGKKNDELRRDTSTYQWFGKCARAVIENPSRYLAGNEPHTYQIIGSIEPPSVLYPTIRYIRLILKYVPSARAHSHAPEIWLRSMWAQSQRGITSSLKKANCTIFLVGDSIR